MNFDKIYLEYADTVYRFLIGLTRNEQLAEELTQECFYKAYKNINTFNGTCKISVWLCQIAKNSYYDHCRKSKGIPIQDEMLIDSGLEAKLLQKEVLTQIHKILHKLDEPYKEVFTLKVFGELPYKDISSLFGKSQNWARVVFFRAKAKIADALEDTNTQ